jgi:integrase/recombinase XerD
MAVYKRGKLWWVRFRFQGREIKRSARTTSKKEALSWEKHLREQLDQEARYGKERRSFEDAAVDFIEEHMPSLKPSSRRRYLDSLKAMKPHLCHLYLDEIDTVTLNHYVTHRKNQGLSNATVRRDLACLSSILTREVGLGRLDKNVAKLMDKRSVREPKSRTRYIKASEEAKLLRACPDYLYSPVVFAIDTGLRLGEQTKLRWEHVDFERGEIAVMETKTDEPRLVPIMDRCRDILCGLHAEKVSPYVFAKADGTPYQRFTRGLTAAAVRANIAHVQWHDLRRTCACRLLQVYGADIYAVCKWLGHSSPAMTAKAYGFLRIDDLKKVVQKRSQSTWIPEEQNRASH